MAEIFGNTLATPINPNAFSGGGSVVVDQTYNPESENAQSGKAVDEAITEALGKIQPNGITAKIVDNVLVLEQSSNTYKAVIENGVLIVS